MIIDGIKVDYIDLDGITIVEIRHPRITGNGTPLEHTIQRLVAQYEAITGVDHVIAIPDAWIADFPPEPIMIEVDDDDDEGDIEID